MKSLPVYVAGFEQEFAQWVPGDAHDLVEMGDTLQAEVSPGGLLGAVEFFRQRAVQHVEHQRALAGAADARQDGERPQRKADVDPLEIVGARATDSEGMSVARAALSPAGNFTLAEEVLRGEAAALDELSGGLER